VFLDKDQLKDIFVLTLFTDFLISKLVLRTLNNLLGTSMATLFRCLIVIAVMIFLRKN